MAVLLRDVEFAAISPYLPEDKKNLTPETYKPFAWEKTPVDKPVKRLSKEEQQKIWAKIDKQNNGR